MSLAPGTRLGPYEVIAPIGAGGMGEVYRARDTKLNRDVALKILPDAFASDTERVARFTREAQVLASLNHPNIAQIYGLEDSASVHALVMELVEGPTLADRIARGPMPLDEALPIAREIADGLEAAHERGIIHRDLKPANVKVSLGGEVKLLDFGLAKAIDPVDRSGDPSHSPTMTSPAMTQAGVILGTAAYMSPEQARGKPVDKRADIWAFGCVLYEMLSGHAAFSRPTVADTLASILERQPDWTALPARTPSPLVRLLRRCLEKDIRRRLHDVADGRPDLEDAEVADSDRSSDMTAAAPGDARRRWLAIAVVSVLAAAGLAGVTLAVLPREGARPVRRFALPLPDGSEFPATAIGAIALSPTSTHVAFVSDSQLFMRSFDQLEARTVPASGGQRFARGPFFSPDGRWLGFWQEGELRKVPVGGGAAVTLAKADQTSSASWTSDDTVLFGQGGKGIWRVSGQGGAPELLVPVDAASQESAHGPQMLPDGATVLFTVGRTQNWDEAQVVAYSPRSGRRTLIVDGATNGRYVSTGHLLYMQRGTLLAVRFDPVRLETIGSPVTVLDGVADAAPSNAAAQFSVSADGGLAYIPGSGGLGERMLVWVDGRGDQEVLQVPAGPYAWVRASPDGMRVAMEVQQRDNIDIWIHDLTRHTQTRLTFGSEADRYPMWSPDSRRIVYNRDAALVWRPADGSGGVELLVTNGGPFDPYGWSDNGRTLIVSRGRAPTDIMKLELDGPRTLQPLLTAEFTNTRPALSPDGRWLAYQSTSRGRLRFTSGHSRVSTPLDGGYQQKVAARPPGLATDARCSIDMRTR